MNSSLNDFDFTDDEIKEQLELLGFKNVTETKFNNFKEDLKKLIENERSSDESQIFNQKLNKIQKEKLVNFNNDTWDDDVDDGDADDYSYNTDISTQFPNGSNDYLPNKMNNDIYEHKTNYRTNNNNKNNKLFKRKIARKTSSGVSKSTISFDNSKDYVNNNNNDHDDIYLNNSFEKLNIENNDNYDTQYGNDDIVQRPIENQVKSFIRPSSSMSGKFEDPSRIKKSNPVRMYHDYAKIWSKQKAPGEKSHKDLRWSIREKMLEKHVVVKKQPNLQSENKYQVPTDKKRQDLRWVIRNAMAYNSFDGK